MLEEVQRKTFGQHLEEMNENAVEINKLTCYWDKVNGSEVRQYFTVI